MSRPKNAIRKKKEKRKKERKKLKKETSELAESINGNPKIVDAIRKLEERIELLENEFG